MNLLIKLILAALVGDGVGTLKMASSNEDTIPVTEVVEGLVSGPLHGKAVTIVLSEEEEAVPFRLDKLLQDVSSPLSVIRLPKPPPEELSEQQNDSLSSHTISRRRGDPGYHPLQPSVVLILIGSDEPSWWPLWIPHENWIAKSIVVLVSSTCSRDLYLDTPLLQRPSSLALLCLSSERSNITSRIPFRVWTWIPYAGSNGSLLELGAWDRDSFRNWNHLFVDRFTDMSAKDMTVLCSTEDSPLVYRTPEGILKGSNYFTLELLSKWLGFKTNYRAEDYMSWTALEDSVKTGDSDVFINYATITPTRYAKFDFTVPYHREGFGMILELPPPLARWRSILYPFTWMVWGLTVMSLLCTSAVFHILNYEQEKSLVTNTIVVLQSILSNPLEVVPIEWRIRNFLLVWWIVSWYINMSYTCNLIAVLTAPAFPKKILTGKDLAESDYRLCMVDYGEFVDEALAESTDPVMSALNDILDMVPTNLSMEHNGEEQCVELVVAGTHAHAETISYVEILFNKMGYGSQVYSLKEQLYPGYLALLVAKNSPWKYKFDEGIQRMLEAGLIQRFYEDCMNDFKGYFQKEKIVEMQPLSLSHLQGPFFLYAVGLVFALLLMVWEVFFPLADGRKDSTQSVNFG